MTDQITASPTVPAHGATRLPAVEVDSYNVEIKDDEGFIGDRASKAAFRDIIENWRKPLRKAGHDPFGDESSGDISKKKLDALLVEGDPEAGGILQGAIEVFRRSSPSSSGGFSSSRPGATPNGSWSAVASAPAASASSPSVARP
jgi:hypothetical protein